MQKKFIIFGVTAIAFLAIAHLLSLYGLSKQGAETPVQQRAIESQKTEVTTQASLPTPGFKQVRASDGKVTFSFEVPNHWLTETRHDGSRELSVEEMREFLATKYDGDIKKNEDLSSDYADLPWNLLKMMSAEELTAIYNRTDIFPNASVAGSNHIWYTDTSWQQVDFKIIEGFNDQTEYYGSIVYKDKADDEYWTKETVGGKTAEVITFGTEIDENGEEVINKGATGGKIYFIPLNDGKGKFIINKQTKGDQAFEDAFKHLLATFKFE